MAVLHQHHHARQGGGIFAQAFQKDLGSDQGFDALAAGFFVKLDRAKQIGQVRDGQRSLAISRRRLDDFFDPVSTVNDGKFSVQAQVGKHAPDCR